MPLSVVILAAGQGKRMNSDLPKVLQPLAGEPLLQHVIRTARALDAGRTSTSSTGTAARRCSRRFDARRARLGAAGRAAGHRPCGDAGHAAHSRRPHGTGAVRRRAADPRRMPQAADRGRRRRRARAAHRRSRPRPRLWPHRARRRAARARASSSTRTPPPNSCRSAKPTPA